MEPPHPTTSGPPLGQRLRELDPPLWALLVLVAGPLALLAGGAAPPWPGGVAWVTALGCGALALALGRRAASRPGGLGQPAQRLATVLLLLAAGLYLGLLSRYTFTIPATGEVGVKGLVCTAEARLVFPGDCPGDDLDALRSAEYEATRIWQAWSVDLLRLALLTSWGLAWASLCVLVAALTRPGFQALIRRAPPTSQAASGHVFISYAHADLQALLPVLRQLHGRGHPLWFDKGLEGASDWDSSLARQVQTCRVLMVFLSPASVGSQWVQREVQYADNLGLPIFAVRIGDAALPDALAIRLPSRQVVEGSPDDIVAQFERVFPPPQAG